jgi:hypothetical protein
MPADHDEQARVEAACAELAAAGQPVTFGQAAARTGISRTTLYRRADLLLDGAQDCDDRGFLRHWGCR